MYQGWEVLSKTVECYQRSIVRQGAKRQGGLWFLVLALLLLGMPVRGAQAQLQGGVTFPVGTATLVGHDGRQHDLTVELALTPEQRMQGLMYRTSLQEGRGMLFDFGETLVVRMWMKNTLIPLDMVFFAPDGRVVGLVRQAQPGDLTPVGPAGPVRAVLELPGGQVDKWGISVGDRLTQPSLTLAKP
ncbi:DUF192 domain-containing protein [Insolitispirillum peregrinum]